MVWQRHQALSTLTLCDCGLHVALRLRTSPDTGYRIQISPANREYISGETLKHAHEYRHLHLYTHTHTHTHTDTDTHWQTHTHTHTEAYARTRAHTHIYTHTRARARSTAHTDLSFSVSIHYTTTPKLAHKMTVCQRGYRREGNYIPSYIYYNIVT